MTAASIDIQQGRHAMQLAKSEWGDRPLRPIGPQLAELVELERQQCTVIGDWYVASYEARADSAASSTAGNASSVATVDMPTITVRPEAADLAYFQANQIVDLAAITVRPDPQDVGAHLASNAAHIVDMPSVTVRPDSEDVRIVAVGALALIQQLASR